MRVVLQKVSSSFVEVDKKVVGNISQGLTLLVGFHIDDDISKLEKIAKKIVNLRIFEDSNHKMNQSLLDIKGKILSVSQFTLYADTKKGYRPNYSKAMKKEDAEKLYYKFNQLLRKYVEVETGIFGSNMKLTIENNGPVTIILEE